MLKIYNVQKKEFTLNEIIPKLIYFNSSFSILYTDGYITHIEINRQEKYIQFNLLFKKYKIVDNNEKNTLYHTFNIWNVVKLNEFFDNMVFFNLNEYKEKKNILIHNDTLAKIVFN